MLNKRHLLLIIYISALLGVAAYQPFNIWPGALVFIALLLYAIRGRSALSTFWAGYIFGVVFYYALLYWIAWATFFGMLPVPLILAFIPAVFCWIFNRLERINEILAVVLAPFIWLSFEYVRTLGQLAFPWNPLGNCFAAYPEFIQYAEYTGVWGISLWAIVLNMFIYRILINPIRFRRTIFLAGAVVIITVGPYIYGASIIPERIENGDVKVALLQGNINRDIKWDPAKLNVSFNTYFRMTDALRGQGVDLIIWPETATPCYLKHRGGYNSIMKKKADDVGIPILTGSPDYRRVDHNEYVYFNSALFYQTGFKEPVLYYKLKLVPFSERIPFSGKLKVLKDIHLGQADFSPGDSLVLFNLDGYRFGVLICFELIFPDLVRSYLERGADFMVTITNDMWFGVTSGPYQHLYAGTIRAVENRVGIARCANTGISLFYDIYGRTYGMSELNERKTLINRVAVNKKRTFYSRHGDYLPIGSIILSLFAVLIILKDSFVKRRQLY